MAGRAASAGRPCADGDEIPAPEAATLFVRISHVQCQALDVAGAAS
jgi:hypothetical protein